MASKVLLGMNGDLESSVAVQLLREQGYTVYGAFLDDGKHNKEKKLFNELVSFYNLPYIILPVKPSSDKTAVLTTLSGIAVRMAFDSISTGHYANVNRRSFKATVSAAVDEETDQSTFIAALPQKVLSKLVLPMGTITKEDAQRKARLIGLPGAGVVSARDFRVINTKREPVHQVRKAVGENYGVSLDGISKQLVQGLKNQAQTR